MRYRLPNGDIVSGEGFTDVGGIQYPLWRMSPDELSAIGVDVYSPPSSPNYDPRFYFISQIGDPVPRPIEGVRRWMKRQVRIQARTITEQFIRNYAQDITHILDKLVDVVLGGATLTQQQTDRINQIINKLKRLSRLDTAKKAHETQIDALQNISAAEAYLPQLDVSEGGDKEDADLTTGPLP